MLKCPRCFVMDGIVTERRTDFNLMDPLATGRCAMQDARYKKIAAVKGSRNENC
jgi:hypothetical protein